VLLIKSFEHALLKDCDTRPGVLLGLIEPYFLKAPTIEFVKTLRAMWCLKALGSQKSDAVYLPALLEELEMGGHAVEVLVLEGDEYRDFIRRRVKRDVQKANKDRPEGFPEYVFDPDAVDVSHVKDGKK